MQLESPTTGAVIRTTSDHAGGFSFDLIPDGVYVLHIGAGNISEGRDYEASDLLIALTRETNRNFLLLTASEICGGPSLELINR